MQLKLGMPMGGLRPKKTPKKTLPMPPVNSGRDLPVVTVESFVRAAMHKDQAAGFVHYANLHKLKKRTIPEWGEAYKAYGSREV